MDLRALVLTADTDLAELVRAQVENLGCGCSLAATYEEAVNTLGWAEAAVVDLAGDGIDDLYRLRIEAPLLRVLAIAPDDDREARAREAGASQVIREPFAIADVIEALRALGSADGVQVIDLTAGEGQPAPAVDAVVDDAPWWASR